jgi:hypothetical protein
VRKLETLTEKDEVLTRLSYDLATLVDTAVAELPVNTQNIIAAVLKSGGHLSVLTVLNPWPVYSITLMSKDATVDPVELCRCSPSIGALRTSNTPTH